MHIPTLLANVLESFKSITKSTKSIYFKYLTVTFTVKVGLFPCTLIFAIVFPLNNCILYNAPYMASFGFTLVLVFFFTTGLWVSDSCIHTIYTHNLTVLVLYNILVQLFHLFFTFSVRTQLFHRLTNEFYINQSCNVRMTFN